MDAATTLLRCNSVVFTEIAFRREMLGSLLMILNIIKNFDFFYLTLIGF
jgi:hypothetical protein